MTLARESDNVRRFSLPGTRADPCYPGRPSQCMHAPLPPGAPPGWYRSSFSSSLSWRGAIRSGTLRRRSFPSRTIARIGDSVQDQTFYWAVGVFILVEGALLYAIFRFRGRPEDPEPPQIHGNTTIEIVWTLIPALILAAIAVPTVKGDLRDQRASDRGGAQDRGDRAPVVVGVPLPRAATSPRPTSCTCRWAGRSSCCRTRPT